MRESEISVGMGGYIQRIRIKSRGTAVTVITYDKFCVGRDRYSAMKWRGERGERGGCEHTYCGGGDREELHTNKRRKGTCDDGEEHVFMEDRYLTTETKLLAGVERTGIEWDTHRKWLGIVHYVGGWAKNSHSFPATTY